MERAARRTSMMARSAVTSASGAKSPAGLANRVNGVSYRPRTPADPASAARTASSASVSPTRPSQAPQRRPDAADGSCSLFGDPQYQEVEPAGPGLLAVFVHGAAESFLALAELLVGEAAHVGVGTAEDVHLGEEAGEAGRRLGNRLERVAAEARERLAHLLDGGIGVVHHRRDLGEELPGEGASRVEPAREPL